MDFEGWVSKEICVCCSVSQDGSGEMIWNGDIDIDRDIDGEGA